MSIGIYGAGNSYDNAYNTRSMPGNTPDVSGIPKNYITHNSSSENDEMRIRTEKRMGLRECETCNNRTYQDGSDDSSVSFKSPGHISPESSASVVRAHEQEHVSNESAKASARGRKVVSQNVSLQTSSCPECGRAYVSGGKTTTVTKSDNKDEKDYFTNKYKEFMSGHFGKVLDIKV